MTTRQDTHKPSLLDPADYSFQAAFYQGSSDAMAQSYMHDMKEYDAAVAAHKTFDGNYSAKFTCDHCGAAFAHGALFLHKPTDELIHVGHICASNTVGLPSKAVAARKRAEKAAAEEAERIKRFKITEAWRTENADVVEFLKATEQAEIAWRDAEKPTKLRAPHVFLLDMVRTFNRYGNLTPNQTEATKKFMAAAEKFAARDAERAAQNEAELENAPAIVAGRQEIAGTVLSTKWKSSDYGETLKMLVKLENGNRVWGTVPGNLQSVPDGQHAFRAVDTGDVVGFTANVKPSDDDEHFGFFKRPTNAVLIVARDAA